MAGYREEPEIFGEEPKMTPAKWRKWFLTLCGTVAYMVPLVIFWTKCDYPDSLGVQITAHGKAGVFEKWWYSYLLIERHRPLDVITFAYMWIPIAGFAGWLAFKQLRTANFSLYSD